MGRTILLAIMLILLALPVLGIIDATDFHTIYANSTDVYNKVDVTGKSNIGAAIKLYNTTSGIMIQTTGDVDNCWGSGGIGVIGSVWFNVTPPVNHTGFNISMTYSEATKMGIGPFFNNRTIVPADLGNDAVAGMSGFFHQALDSQTRMRDIKFINGASSYSGTGDAWANTVGYMFLDVTLDGTNWSVKGYINGTESYNTFDSNLTVANSGYLNGTIDMGISQNWDAGGCPTPFNATVYDFTVMWKGGEYAPEVPVLNNYSVSWFSNSTNVTAYNYTTIGSFSINWTSGNATGKNVSYSIFSSNNSGTWTNATEQAGNAYSVIFTDVLTLNQSQANYTIGYKWFGNSSDNLWNVTDTFILTKTNTTTTPIINYTPVWDTNTSNATRISGTVAGYSVRWAMPNTSANSNLSYAIFSHNNSGTWVNDTPVALGNMSYVVSNSLTLNNSGFVSVIGYKWFANSTDALWNVTDLFITNLDPYVPIYTCTELVNITNNWTGFVTGTGPTIYRRYYLMNDIDCQTTCAATGGEGCNPIWNFWGEFNGQNYTISNFYVNRTSADNLALFGSTWTPTLNSTYIHNFVAYNFSILGPYSGGVYKTGSASAAIVGGNCYHNPATMQCSADNDRTRWTIVRQVAVKDSEVQCVSAGNKCGGIVGYQDGENQLFVVDSYIDSNSSVIVSSNTGHAGGISGGGFTTTYNSWSGATTSYYGWNYGLGGGSYLHTFTISPMLEAISTATHNEYWDYQLSCLGNLGHVICGTDTSGAPNATIKINSIYNQSQWGYWFTITKANNPPMNDWDNTWWRTDNLSYQNMYLDTVNVSNAWNLSRIGSPTLSWETFDKKLIFYAPAEPGVGYQPTSLNGTYGYGYDGYQYIYSIPSPFATLSTSLNLTWEAESQVSCVMCATRHRTLDVTEDWVNGTMTCGINAQKVRYNCSFTNLTGGLWDWKQYANDTGDNWVQTQEYTEVTKGTGTTMSYFTFIINITSLEPIVLWVQNPSPVPNQNDTMINVSWLTNSTYDIHVSHWYINMSYPNGTFVQSPMNTSFSNCTIFQYNCNVNYPVTSMTSGSYTWNMCANSTTNDWGCTGNYTFTAFIGSGMTATATTNATYLGDGGALLTTLNFTSSVYNMTHYWLGETFPNGTRHNYSVSAWNATGGCSTNFTNCGFATVGLVTPPGPHYVYAYTNNSGGEIKTNEVYFFVASNTWEFARTKFLGSDNFTSGFGIWNSALSNWTSTNRAIQTNATYYQPPYAWDLNGDGGVEYVYMDNDTIRIYENKTLDLKANYSVPDGWNSRIIFVPNYSNGTSIYHTGIVWITVENAPLTTTGIYWNEVFWNSNADHTFKSTDVTSKFTTYQNGTGFEIGCGSEKCAIIYSDLDYVISDSSNNVYTSSNISVATYNHQGGSWSANSQIIYSPARTGCFPRYGDVLTTDYDHDGTTEIIFNFIEIAGNLPTNTAEKARVVIMNLTGTTYKIENIINLTTGDYVHSSNISGGKTQTYCQDVANGVTNVLVYDADNNPANNDELVMAAMQNVYYNTQKDFVVYSYPYTSLGVVGWYSYADGHGLIPPYYHYGYPSNLIRASVFSGGDHDFCVMGYLGDSVAIATYNYYTMAQCGTHWNNSFDQTTLWGSLTWTPAYYPPANNAFQYSDMVYSAQFRQDTVSGFNPSEFVTPYAVFYTDLINLVMDFNISPLAEDNMVVPVWDTSTYDLLMAALSDYGGGQLKYVDDGGEYEDPVINTWTITPCTTGYWKNGTDVSVWITATTNSSIILPSNPFIARLTLYAGNQTANVTSGWTGTYASGTTAMVNYSTVQPLTNGANWTIEIMDSIYKGAYVNGTFKVNLTGDEWGNCVSTPTTPTNITTNETAPNLVQKLSTLANLPMAMFWLLLIVIVMVTEWVALAGSLIRTPAVIISGVALIAIGAAFGFISPGLTLIIGILAVALTIFIISNNLRGRGR